MSGSPGAVPPGHRCWAPTNLVEEVAHEPIIDLGIVDLSLENILFEEVVRYVNMLMERVLIGGWVSEIKFSFFQLIYSP